MSKGGPVASAAAQWADLAEVHGRLAELASKDGGGGGGSGSGGGGGAAASTVGGGGVSAGSTRLQMLESKLQWYQAELDTAKATHPAVPVQSIEESVAAVQHEVAKGFVGSVDALQRAQDRLLLLEDQIVHERRLQRQHRDVASALQIKLDEARDAAEEAAGSQGGGGGGSAAQSSQQRQLGLRNKSMLLAMNDFLSKHFPRPTALEVEHGGAAGDGAAAEGGSTPGSGKRSRAAGGIASYLQQPSEMLSMSEILEELMNIAITKPHAPYVVIDGRYWEPYVELLVRWGIVLKHPQHSNQVKLVAFHI